MKWKILLDSWAKHAQSRSQAPSSVTQPGPHSAAAVRSGSARAGPGTPTHAAVPFRPGQQQAATQGPARLHPVTHAATDSHAGLTCRSQLRAWGATEGGESK